MSKPTMTLIRTLQTTTMCCNYNER